jgi:3-hydroxy-9,10-secoandrosta-1,3,5(10)-triene-9,17-dione monooxygenase
MIREQAEESQKRGAYSPQAHEAFKAAGIYRITQPKMFGGFEFELPTFFRAMLEISKADPSSGWCLTLGASHAYVVSSHWPEKAQREVMSSGHFVAPHRPVPFGKLTRTDGGYMLSGQWNYCSGIPYATHFIGGAFLTEGSNPPVNMQVIVPRGEYTILDDWGGDNTLGMQASGSNSVKIENVFVPEHMAVPMVGLWCTPETMANGTPGTRLHKNPMYLGRVMGPYHCALVTPVVGAAFAAIEEYEMLTRTLPTLHDPMTKRADHPDFQRWLGKAIAMADAAEAILFNTIEKYMSYTRRFGATGQVITIEENLRLWTQVQQAGHIASDVVQMLFDSSGSSSSRKGTRFQRYYRDITMYRGHISSQRDMFGLHLGNVRLGHGLPFWGV